MLNLQAVFIDKAHRYCRDQGERVSEFTGVSTAEVKARQECTENGCKAL